MVRSRGIGLGFGFPLAVLALGLAGCDERNQFIQPPPPEVTVATPVMREVVDSIEFTGTTRATARVDLRARVGGYLQQIEFEDGQMVEAGELLFVIEQAPFKAELESANANVKKADAALQLAKANLARIAGLFRRNVATQQEHDVAVAEQAGAEAEVAVAEAAVTQVKLDLGYTKINAPISGRIGRHMIDLGSLVQAEQTLLATIESIDPIHAYFHISESDLLRFMEMLRENKLPDPETSPPELHLGLANESGFPHVGHLDYREFGVDPGTGTIMRRGSFPNPKNVLVPGLFVRIRAEIGKAEERLTVEKQALGSDQQGDFVLVVNDENKVERRSVRLGSSLNGWRVVEEGLDANDWVVVNGLLRARPGAEVNPQEEQAMEAAQEKADLAPASAKEQGQAAPQTKTAPGEAG